jgi:hypothetical protein
MCLRATVLEHRIEYGRMKANADIATISVINQRDKEISAFYL